MPVTKCDSPIVLNVGASLGDEWCAFEHQASLELGQPPQTIFVGACRLVDVYKLNDGRTNSTWRDMFVRGGQLLVRILATGTQAECSRFAVDHMRGFDPLPICNLRGVNLKHNRRAIRCITNGQIYRTQSEAAFALGLSQSSISQHLAGKLKSCGAYVFEYA